MQYGLTNALATWMRATPYLLDPVAVGALHECDREAPVPSCVQVRVTGSPTGTVTVRGLVDGSPSEEALEWEGSGGYRVTAKLFQGEVTLIPDLSGGETIEAKALGSGGEPHMALYRVRGPGHPVTVVAAPGKGQAHIHGLEDEQTHRILVGYEETWRPRQGDRVALEPSGATLEILSVVSEGVVMHGGSWDCRAKSLEGRRSE